MLRRTGPKLSHRKAPCSLGSGVCIPGLGRTPWSAGPHGAAIDNDKIPGPFSLALCSDCGKPQRDCFIWSLQAAGGVSCSGVLLRGTGRLASLSHHASLFLSNLSDQSSLSQVESHADTDRNAFQHVTCKSLHFSYSSAGVSSVVGCDPIAQ